MIRCNTALGFATVIADEISGGGKPVVRVLLDTTGEERVFLRAFVTESDTPVPQSAKNTRKPRTKKERPEPENDSLLVPSLDESPRMEFSSGIESTVTV